MLVFRSPGCWAIAAAVALPLAVGAFAEASRTGAVSPEGVSPFASEALAFMSAGVDASAGAEVSNVHAVEEEATRDQETLWREEDARKAAEEEAAWNKDELQKEEAAHDAADAAVDKAADEAARKVEAARNVETARKSAEDEAARKEKAVEAKTALLLSAVPSLPTASASSEATTAAPTNVVSSLLRPVASASFTSEHNLLAQVADAEQAAEDRLTAERRLMDAQLQGARKEKESTAEAMLFMKDQDEHLRATIKELQATNGELVKANRRTELRLNDNSNSVLSLEATLRDAEANATLQAERAQQFQQLYVRTRDGAARSEAELEDGMKMSEVGQRQEGLRLRARTHSLEAALRRTQANATLQTQKADRFQRLDEVNSEAFARTEASLEAMVKKANAKAAEATFQARQLQNEVERTRSADEDLRRADRDSEEHLNGELRALQSGVLVVEAKALRAQGDQALADLIADHPGRTDDALIGQRRTQLPTQPQRSEAAAVPVDAALAPAAVAVPPGRGGAAPSAGLKSAGRTGKAETDGAPSEAAVELLRLGAELRAHLKHKA